MGGGILDAFNVVGTWANHLTGGALKTPNTAPDLNWTFDDLDANNIPDVVDNKVADLFAHALNQEIATPVNQTQEQQEVTDNTLDNIAKTAIGAATGYAANAVKEVAADAFTAAAEGASTWITDILLGAMVI